jgi:hypothetical protein
MDCCAGRSTSRPLQTIGGWLSSHTVIHSPSAHWYWGLHQEATTVCGKRALRRPAARKPGAHLWFMMTKSCILANASACCDSCSLSRLRSSMSCRRSASTCRHTQHAAIKHSTNALPHSHRLTVLRKNVWGVMRSHDAWIPAGKRDCKGWPHFWNTAQENGADVRAWDGMALALGGCITAFAACASARGFASLGSTSDASASPGELRDVAGELFAARAAKAQVVGGDGAFAEPGRKGKRWQRCFDGSRTNKALGWDPRQRSWPLCAEPAC